MQMREDDILDRIDVDENGEGRALLNAIVGFERTIVSETAGTTRDSVDIVITVEGRRFRFIDTSALKPVSMMKVRPPPFATHMK